MAKQLNQVVAAEQHVRKRAQDAITGIHQRVQKSNQTTGLSRTYRPRNEDGETFPSESVRVQLKVEDSLTDISAHLADLFDVVATKEWGNADAVADIEIDDRILLADVPVTYLLFLEKQLVDVATHISKLPTLSQDDVWHWDEGQQVWRTDQTTTNRTKKVYRNHEKAPATDRHPAQVEIYTEDETVGYWDLVKFSGAVPPARVRELAERVSKLQVAVKHAREKANSRDIDAQHVGEAIMDYVLSGAL